MANTISRLGSGFQVSYDDEGGGPAGRLMTSLIGIQRRKEEAARQQAQLELQQEQERRMQEAADFDKQTRLLEITRNLAAAGVRPNKTVTAPPVDTNSIEDQMGAMSPATTMPGPGAEIPRKTIRIGDVDFDVPLPDWEDIQKRKAEEAKNSATVYAAQLRALAPNKPDNPLEAAGYTSVPGVGLVTLGADNKPEVAIAPPDRSSAKGRNLVNSKGEVRYFSPEAESAMAESNPGEWRVAVPGDYKKPKENDPRVLKMSLAALGGPGDDMVKGGTTLWALAKRINATQFDSMKGFIQGKILGTTTLGGRLGGERGKDINQYESSVAGFASGVAKSLGEAGRLSDQDIARTKKLFPEVGDTAEMTDRKLNAIYRVMNSGLDLSQVPEGQRYNTLLTAIQAEQSQNGANGNMVAMPSAAPKATTLPDGTIDLSEN